MKTLLDIAFRAAIALAVLYGLWHGFGPFGLVFGMPVLGIFAFPLVHVVAGYPRFVSRLAMRKVEGRYFAYRGMSLDIAIDERAVCWVSTADLRKLVPDLPTEAVLVRMHAGQLKECGDPRQWRITIHALSLFLARSTDADNTRFATWLERDVARPARNRLERGTAASR